MIHSLLVSSLLLGSSLTVRGRNPLAVSLCLNKTVSHPSENRLVLGMGKYSLHTVLDSSSTILFLSKGLYISSSTKKYITLDYLIIYTSYARVREMVIHSRG